LAVSTGVGNAKPAARGLSCSQAGDTGTRSDGNVAFVGVKTHYSLGFGTPTVERLTSTRDRGVAAVPQSAAGCRRISADGNLRHLEGDVAAVANDLRADLDQHNTLLV
jgi:hypothetical protein